MKQHYARLIIALSLMLIIASGCGSRISMVQPVSSDMDVLSDSIRFPARPRSALWQRIYLSDPNTLGPSDHMLYVLLTFDKDTVEELVAEPQLQTVWMMHFEKERIPEWFPQSVTEHLAPTEDPELMLLDLPVYDAAPFIKHNTSYLNGRFVRIGNTNQILLSVHTS